MKRQKKLQWNPKPTAVVGEKQGGFMFNTAILILIITANMP